jgi:hypothetical protein
MRRTVRQILGVALGAVATLGLLAPVSGHSWYPRECCSDNDCAPVENAVYLVPAGAAVEQLIVRSKHGTAVVPASLPIRTSNDDRMHVCMRFDPFGEMEVICLFVPRVSS